MSRCFPYPPPGYVGNGASGGALIKPIKLQTEREKTKTERRNEKKREKKETRKEKKEKDIGVGKARKVNNENCYQEEKFRVDSIKGYFQKEKEDEAEQLEKSDLTEEHEQPICYLSDSTQSSNKRKRDTPPSNGSQNHGNHFRIRFTLKKHREPDAPLNREQLYSTGMADSLAQQKCEIVCASSQEQCCSTDAKTNTVTKEQIAASDKELSCSASGKKEFFAQDSAVTAIGTTLYKNEMQRSTESLYKTLVEDWAPFPLQFDRNDFDQEWLFRTKQLDRHGPKRFKAGNDVLQCGSPMMWPCGQCLPEADIYALPYTVPF